MQGHVLLAIVEYLLDIVDYLEPVFYLRIISLVPIRYPDRSPNNICIVFKGQQGMLLTIATGAVYGLVTSQVYKDNMCIYREGAYSQLHLDDF